MIFMEVALIWNKAETVKINERLLHRTGNSLNGTSSAGKTTLAKALQQKLNEPHLYVALDQYRDSLPDKYRGLNLLRGPLVTMV